MAKGANIGFLNFGIDGDNKELLKKLEQAEKKAVSIEQIFKNIKLNTGGNSISTDVQKAQLAADKMAKSQNQVAQSATNALRAEQQLATAVTNENNAKARGVVIENQRQAALQKSLLYAKQGEAVSAESARKEALAKQKLIIEEERLNGLRKRNALMGVQGQRDLASAYGLTNKTMFSQRNILQQLSQAAGIYFSVYQVGAFIKELAVVSGEFEKQRVSLAAIIGDADAANKIFNQIKDLAVISPFNFKDLTNYAKQLSAFSIPTNEIFDTTKRLADLSAGLGVDMSRIILAYGQVRSAAVLRGQELRQFTEAGIPLVDQLAKKFSELEGRVVSAGEVFDKISNRQVSFGMIKDIITDLTSEGGKFFEMQELQSATLAGKISNLRDNYDIMLDSIGRANHGLLHGALDGLVDLMDNWEKYWGILKGIIATYGAYKAAIAVLAISDQISKYGSLAKMIQSADLAQKSLNSTLLSNPYVFAATAITALVMAISLANDEANRLNESLIKIYGERLDSIKKATNDFDELYNKLKSSTEGSENFRKAISALNSKYGEYLPNILNEKNALDELRKNYDLVTQSIYNKQKAEAYDRGVTEINNQYIDDSKKAFDILINKLESSGIAKKAAKDLVTQYSIELKKQTGEYNPADIFNNIFKNYFGTSQDYFGGVSGLLNDIKQSTPFIRNIYGTNTTGWETARDALYNYSIIFDKQSAATKQYSDYIDVMFSNTSYKTQAEAKAIEGINEKYKKLADDLSNKKLSIDEYKKSIDNINTSKLKETLYFYEEMAKINPKNARLDIIDKLKEKIDLINSSGTDWRKYLQDNLGTTITIQTDSNINDVVDEMEKKYKEVKTRMDERRPILLKFGFDFNTNTFPSPLDVNPAIRQLGEGYAADAKDANNLDKAAQSLGKTLKDLYSTKEKGESKDKFTEDLKRQVELVKSAKSEYDKLIKVISKDDAISKIRAISEYSSIGNIDLSDEGYIKYINEQLKKIEKRNTTSAKNVRAAWNKELGQIQIENIIKEATKANEQIEKELSKYKDKYSLYEYIFGKTGDKSQALKIAFGDIRGQVKTYRDALISAIDKSTDPEQKKKLQEQLVDFDFTQKSDFAKRMTDLVAEFKSVDDQITIIKAKGEETRLEIEKNADNASRDIVEQRLRANQESVNKQVLDLTNGILQATDSYQRLFGDIADISQKELQYLIDKWKSALVNATKNSAGNMVISIDGKEFETTEKEIANFTKRILKTESELRSRNPFKALKDSINDLKNNQSDIARIKAEIESLYASIKLAENSKSSGSTDPLNDLIISSSKGKITELQNNLKNLDAKGATGLQKIGTAIGAIGTGISDVSQSLSGMFDSLGNEELADTIGLVGELAGAAADIGQGLASKNPVQVIQGIAKGISSIANFHDKKLDRAIKKSQLEVKRLQNAYESVSRFLERKLGAITSSQAKQQIDNLKKQRQELIKQQEAESKKKKKDKAAIEDYKATISELGDKIAYFYEDLFKELYNFDFKSIADQISSALVDAFKSGEDAAKSFDNTVAEIINKLASDMISLQIIQPAMEQLRNYLFGSNGVFMDGELSVSDAKGLVAQLSALRGSIGDAKTIWDALNEAAKEAGINLSEQASKDTLSKGIQSITEDTGDLLGSYINAMRAEQAVQGVNIMQLVTIAQLQTDQFANMYAELLRIQLNTLATANNTSAIAQTTKDTYNLLKQATIKGSGTAINLA